MRLGRGFWFIMSVLTLWASLPLGAWAQVIRTGPGRTSSAIVTFTLTLPPRLPQFPDWEHGAPAESLEPNCQRFYRTSSLAMGDWTVWPEGIGSLQDFKNKVGSTMLPVDVHANLTTERKARPRMQERPVFLDVLSVFY